MQTVNAVAFIHRWKLTQKLIDLRPENFSGRLNDDELPGTTSKSPPKQTPMIGHIIHDEGATINLCAVLS